MAALGVGCPLGDRLQIEPGGDGMADFAQTITTAYAVDGTALDLGRGVHDGAVFPDASVKLPLRMVNRHGLIAGATGTGKTKTLQGLAEQLSTAGVPVFVADVKGDLSGIAEPGDASGAAGKRADGSSGLGTARRFGAHSGRRHRIFRQRAFDGSQGRALRS